MEIKLPINPKLLKDCIDIILLNGLVKEDISENPMLYFNIQDTAQKIIAKTAQIVRGEIIKFLEDNHLPEFWAGSAKEEKLWQDFKAGKGVK